MDIKRALQGYATCLLRFPEESNGDALERFFRYYQPLTSSVADMIAQYAYKGTALTPRALADKLGVDVEQFSQNGLSPDAIELYAAELGENTRRKILREAAAKLQQGDMASAQKLLLEADSNETVDSVTLSLAEHIALGMQLFQAEQERLASGIVSPNFPWQQLNNRLGIRSDDLILMTGQTKVGKSSAAHQIAMHNARSMRVVYFHNEDSIEKLRDRRIAQLQIHFDPRLEGTGYDYGRLSKRTIKNAESVARIQQANQLALDLMSDRLTYVYCVGWTPEQIISEWRRLKHTQDVKLVVIDYLNKVEVSHHIKARGNSIVYGLEQAVELFKRQAGQPNFECPCILVQQENDDGSTRDLRSTYIKAQAHISLQREPGNDKIVLLRANDAQPGEVNALFYEKYMLWLER